MLATSGTAHTQRPPYPGYRTRCVRSERLSRRAVLPGLTARDHLRILALAAGVDSSRADDALDIVDLSSVANRRIGGFPWGMRQRLGLAGALIANPEILILDEPANGLDPEGVRWLRDLLRGYAADGGTVLGPATSWPRSRRPWIMW